MKPTVDRVLEVAATHLMRNLAPALGSGYEQSNTMLLAVLLSAVRQEFERAVARHVEENRELRRLFAEAAPVVEDAGLRNRLEGAAAGEDASLLVSDLERSNADLRGLLIDLHAHVEELSSPEARRIETAIWRELVASTERRHVSMGSS